jgi:hypothetical protein
MFRKRLLIAATAVILTLSQAMAAGEQLQLIQDAEQLKTALAGEPVVLTPQIVSVTIAKCKPECSFGPRVRGDQPGGTERHTRRTGEEPSR